MCVLEGLAALVGMQVTPLLPLLKCSARRGATLRRAGEDASDSSASAAGPATGNSFKRRSSEFVLTIVRKSASFR